jgi:hypothetical protein
MRASRETTLVSISAGLLIEFAYITCANAPADPLNPLKGTPTRPPVRHVIMAYGVDKPTHVGYVYETDISQVPETRPLSRVP